MTPRKRNSIQTPPDATSHLIRAIFVQRIWALAGRHSKQACAVGRQSIQEVPFATQELSSCVTNGSALPDSCHTHLTQLGNGITRPISPELVTFTSGGGREPRRWMLRQVCMVHGHATPLSIFVSRENTFPYSVLRVLASQTIESVLHAGSR